MYGGYENNPNARVICPYNPQHKIVRSRLPMHLIRCEEKYPADYLEICPYSASHRFRKEEMEKHVLTCPMKRILDVSLHKTKVCSNIYGGPRANMKIRTTIDLIECWSDEDDDSGFGSLASTPAIVKETNTPKFRTKNNDSDDKPLRAPYGYPQVMLLDDSDFEDEEDDNCSVASYMGMGRGKPKISVTQILRRLGAGRGRKLNVS
ncbi:gametocyte-specific factor 1-like [Leptopilina heterotoma]|uniref:gametocyte-specific factor 1-like n=1 Tax=Leptopilina heterotoma TaxID=63436 RepID=UPI001CA962F6|nr:gametocyte-specific factor 1-like [Leptopilina heterotoma]